VSERSHEEALRHPDQEEGTGPESFDHDIKLRAVIWIGAALAAAALVVQLLIWWMVQGFERFDKRRDVAPAPIEQQVKAPALPPGPRLQTTPELDLRRMRAEEAERLEHAAWVDPARGTVRIPIEVAMEAYLAGVRAPAPPLPPGAAAAPAPAAIATETGIPPGTTPPTPGTTPPR
jgi:hypothetical protein